MRRVAATIPAANYRTGIRLDLFGPDADGALDTSAPVQSGRRPIHVNVTRPLGHHEAGHQRYPHHGSKAWAGHHGARHHGQAHHQATARIEIVGEEHEYGRFEYGVQAIDSRENQSGSLVAGTVFINSAPRPARHASVAVAAGVVTMTITEHP